jgi:hypothetical protein
MKVTCALTVDQVSNLYKHAYKSIKQSIKEGKPFDANAYIEDMFNRIAERTDPANAAKFAQQLPALIVVASMQPDTEGVDLSLDPLRKLSSKFRNPDTGLIDTLKYFRPEETLEDFEAEVAQKEEEAFEVKEVTDVEKLKEFNELRLRPFSVFGTTMQEFDPKNPEDKTDFTKEVLNEDRRRIYNAIRAINGVIDPDMTPGLNDVIYQGTRLKLKPTLVNDIPADHLDKHTKRNIERGLILEQQGKADPNVTPVKERVALVITDQYGTPVKFDDQGNINDDGKVVYQFLRTVRKEDGKYTAMGLYNKESQVTHPAEIAAKVAASFNLSLKEYAKEMGQTITEVVEDIDKAQQEELKELYDFVADFLDTKQAKLLPITSVNQGIENYAGGARLTLNKLAESSISKEELRDIYSSLTLVGVEAQGVTEGFHTINIYGNTLTLDRAHLPENIARKIAQALTSPNLTGEEKMDFAEQFLTNKITRSARRYLLKYDPATKEFSIKVVPEGKAFTKEVQPVDLTSPEAEKIIFEALINATTDPNGNTSSSRMRYRADLVNGYYDFQDGQLVKADYINDVLKNLDGEIITTPKTELNLFNAYMRFALPSEEVDNAKRNATFEENYRSYTRQLKDELVDEVNEEEGATKSFEVKYVHEGTNQEGYAYGTFTIHNQEGQPVTVDLLRKFKDDPKKLKKAMPKVGDTITVQVEDNQRGDKWITDELVVYNSKGEAIGHVRETDFEDPREEQRKYPDAKTVKKAKTDTQDEDNLNPPGTSNPSEGSLFDSFDLDRKTSLPKGVTKADIRRATEWWNNSPLTKFISLGQMANITNSDAFAKFIVSGSTLLNDGKLAKILVNKHTGGDMVDVYHEAWHAFSQLFLTKEEKRALYNEVRNRGGKWAKMSFFEIEEALAEEFRSYAKNPKAKKDSPKRNSLFRRILNFIKNLFKNVSPQEPATDILEIPMVKEMFENLYFASENPALLNRYTPLIENVLNRGISQERNRNEDALSVQDSDLIVETIDSILSEVIDEMSARTGNVPGSKAGTLKILSDKKTKKLVDGIEQTVSNRDVAYKLVKMRLQKQLEARMEQLGSITEVPFNSIETLAELEKNSVAIMRTESGDKYVLLRSQVDNFDKLSLNSKQGDRIKGESYFGIDIIGDFYTHETIRDAKKRRANIIIVDNVEDAVVQYENYIQGGAKFEKLEMNPNPVKVKPLTAEQAKLQDDIRILQTAINNFGDKKRGVINYHIENSRFDIVRQKFIEQKEEEEEEETDAAVPENTAESERYGDKKVGQKSLDQVADSEVRYILKSLFQISEGAPVMNRLGFKKLANFGTMWDNVVRAIGGIEDPVEAYQKLNDKVLWKSWPELEQLITYKLPHPEQSAKHASEFDITSSFWQTFKRKRVPYMQLTAFGSTDGYTLNVIQASYETGVLRRSFSENFRTQTPAENAYVHRISNRTYLNLEKVVEDFKDPNSRKGTFNANKGLSFVRALGMNLDDLKVIKDELNKRSEFYGLPYIYNVVRELYELEQELKKKKVLSKDDEYKLRKIEEFKIDPVFVLSRVGGLSAAVLGREITERAQIERIAVLHGKYGSQYANFSVLNPEGNVVQEHIDDHTASRIVYALNDAKKMTDLWNSPKYQHMSYLDPKTNSFTMRSQIMQALFSFTDGEFTKQKGKSLTMFIDAGTQNTVTGEGAVTTSLDFYGKNLQEMHMMLKGGIQEFIRHASKSSSFGIAVKGGLEGPIGKKDTKLYVDIESFIEEKGEVYAFEKIILPYIAVEFERLKRFRANKEEFSKYVGYNRKVEWDGKEYFAGEVFTAFDDVLSDATKEKIYALEGTDLIAALKNDPKLKQEMAQDVKKYFDDQTTQAYNRLQESKFIDPKLKNKLKVHDLAVEEQEEVLSKAYVYNSWIHNFETIGLLYGDIAQYNHAKEEMHKRNTGLTSGGLGMRTDIQAQSFIKSVWNKGSYATQLGGKYRNIQYDGTFNTAVIQDVVRSSIYIDDIKKAWRRDYESKFKNSMSKEEMDKEINQRIARDIEEYEKMTEGDGQGLITFDGYRTLKKLSNQWTQQQEDLFQAIIKGEEIRPEDIKEFFPVYKLQYFGAIASTQLPVTGMHKFSLMPLIPTMIKEGSDMDKLHKKMMEQDIQYVVFQSGSKVSGVTKDGFADKVHQDSQKDLLEKIDFTPNKIYLEYLKDVTKVKSKYANRTVFATQLRKIIMESLYEEGQVLSGIDKAKVEQYEQAVDNYTEILEIELLNDIGFEYKDGKYTGDLGKFLTVIQDELGRKEVPEHLIKLIGMTREGNLKVDLSLHLEADTIEKTLLALFEKRLIKQKVKGEALVQVSSAMTNGIWDKPLRQEFENVKDPKERKRWLGSNNLPFYLQEYDKKGNPLNTKLMKVAIALQGDFLNLLKLEHNDGEEIGDIDRLNQMIKNEEWLAKDDNRASITLAGVRIPTQTLGFVEAAEVYEFLDPTAGNIIILPSEIVVKNGSDFDVDKLTAFMPSINPDGSFVKTNYTNDQLKKQIKDMKEAGQKGINSLIRNQKNALENELIRSIKEIIEIPSNYAQLTKPTGVHTLQTIAKDLQKYTSTTDRFENVHDGPRMIGDKQVISPTRVLEAGYNLQKHIANLTGKKVLGLAAIENALHSVLNAIGAKMPATYKAQIYSEGNVVDTDVEYKMRLFLDHNTTTNENGDTVISLAKLYSADGKERISDLFSQAMNGLVDVEKDDWIAYIQANMEIAPTLFYLFSAGVPVKQAIYFVSNPLVRKYAEKQRELGGAYYSVITGEMDPMAQALIRYTAAKEVLDASFPTVKSLREFENAVNRAKLEEVLPKLKGEAGVYYKSGRTDLFKFANEAGIRKMLRDGVRIEKIENEEGDKVYSLYSSPVSNSKYYHGVNVATERPVFNDNGNFDQDELYKIAKGEGEGDPQTAVAAFMHFLEIEKQIKGVSSMKRLANPDTTRSKTVQEVISKKQGLEKLLTDSKADPSTVRRLVEESILSSFYKNDLVLKLMEPLFTLRNNPEITDFILDKLGSSRVMNKYGSDQEGISQFIREFKNAVVNYIFQNHMTNFVNEDGNVVDYPDSYRGFSIKTTTKNINSGVEVNTENNTVTINPEILSRDYDQALYLKSAEGKDAYTTRDLGAFSEDNDPFVGTDGRRNKKSSFFKYVIEKAILATKYDINSIKNTKEFKMLSKGLTDEAAFETFLTKRALINSYNRKFLMEMETFSYTQTILDIIKSYPSLKETYPILAQITQADTIGEDKVITLADKSRVKGDLATSYYNNLRQLADPNIKKVDNKDDNLMISGLFKMFPLAMIYQHGVGYSKNGFNAALPYDAFIAIMRNASDNFLKNQLNDSTLNIIYGRLLAEGSYKDYVVSEEEYNGYNIASKEATMSFLYRGDKRPEVTADSTFEAVVKGERTATTRYAGDRGYSTWVKTKPGDVIKFWSSDTVGKGQSMLVKVTATRKIDFTEMSDAEIEEWSKREGWSVEYGKKHRNFTSGNRGVQIEFELMDSGITNSYENNEDPESVPTAADVKIGLAYEVRDGNDQVIARITRVSPILEDGKPTWLGTYTDKNGNVQENVSFNTDDFISMDPVDLDDYTEISSKSPGLAGALTNPTEISKRNGNIDQSYPITYGGVLYKDVEEAYQKLKDTTEARRKPKKEDSRNYRLMVDLISAKLNQFPELAEQIKQRGGSEWILNATHQPTTKNTVWETGGQDWFIQALNDAYENIKPAADPAQTTLFQDEHLAINAFYDTLSEKDKKKLGKLEDLIDEYEQLTYSSEEAYIRALKCRL